MKNVGEIVRLFVLGVARALVAEAVAALMAYAARLDDQKLRNH